MFRRLIALAIVIGLIAPAAAQPAQWPDDAPEQYILAHVDVETTGLDPAFHEIISIGMIYTDLEGEELGRLDLRIMPPHPDRIDPGARAVNGFDEALWRRERAIDEAEATRRIRAFHEEMRGDRDVLFTAYNVWFDQAFLSAMLARNCARWRALFHYHVLDIPSMAWSMGYRGLTGSRLASALGVAEETRIPTEHTGMTGAAFNVSLYRALRARQQR